MLHGIYTGLLAGAAAEEVQTAIDRLPSDQRELLFTMLSGIMRELWNTCIDRAIEVDRVLIVNGFASRTVTRSQELFR